MNNLVMNSYMKATLKNSFRTIHSSVAKDMIAPDTEEFKVLNLRKFKAKERIKTKYVKPENLPPRELSMPTDQDWSNVWPGPRTFHPASVPLPIRQGTGKNKAMVPPKKYANTELMKIPNFLHLTPPAVKKHCEALRRFCTAWPKELHSEELCEKYFPLEVTTTDYCHSSPKIRDPKSRVVTFKFKSKRLALNDRARDKFLRLVGERHDVDTDIVTFVTDRCTLKKQNYDYNRYLLLAVFYESWNVEDWESEKCEEDMEYYDWERNPSKKAYLDIKLWPKRDSDIQCQNLEDDQIAQDYKKAVTDIFNKGEDESTLLKYKEGALKVLFPSFQRELYLDGANKAQQSYERSNE